MLSKARSGSFLLAAIVLFCAAGAARAQYAIRFAAGDYAVSPGGTVMLPIVVDSQCPVAGFSFGVTHDASQLTLEDVQPGDDLTAALAGAELDPDFTVVERSPQGGDGFYVAVIPGGSGDAAVLLPAGVSTVYEAHYSAAVSAAGGNTTVQTSGGLQAPGDPAAPVVPLVLDVRPSGDAACSGLPASERDQAVASAGVGVFVSVPFDRGNADGQGSRNIGDAVFILGYLFRGGSAGDCPAALNVDGSTRSGSPNSEDLLDIELTDAVALLNFLFRQGLPPAAPFPECGQPDSPLGADMICRQFDCD